MSNQKGDFLQLLKKWLLNKWSLIAVAAATITSVILLNSPLKTNPPADKIDSPNSSSPTDKTHKGSESEKELNSKSNIPHFNRIQTGPGTQTVQTISKANADRTAPIFITDTIVYSPNSPSGYGNQLEFFDNQPDDSMYVEKEHNTVWYKFISRETGILTFDIIPIDMYDDYDFMLFIFSGSDFYANVLSKKIKPIRTCISRNNVKLKSKTGLIIDETAKSFIHSGTGDSFVKYIRVQKGEVYFILLDNVYDKGKGHAIHFHYKPEKPGDLYVGKLISLSSIKFTDNDIKLQPGAEKALDTLYNFLIEHPNIKIEIQGHVNAYLGARAHGIYKSDIELSKERALVIYKYLIEKGIDNKRLTTIGYGASRMKVPKPISKKDCLANIRAEIMILSLDYKKDMENQKKKK